MQTVFICLLLILKLVYKLKGVENTCLVTDALAYAAYEGNEPIDPRYIIEDGVCKMADHSALAGSRGYYGCVGSYDGEESKYSFGRCCAYGFETPARSNWCERSERGIVKGKDADIVILDKELNVRCVWSMGKVAPGTDGLLHK